MILFLRSLEMAICPHCQKNVTLEKGENQVVKEMNGLFTKNVMYYT